MALFPLCPLCICFLRAPHASGWVARDTQCFRILSGPVMWERVQRGGQRGEEPMDEMEEEVDTWVEERLMQTQF